MIDERFDNLEEMTEDSDLEEQAQLYEHFRVVADKGQEPLRVDKFLFEHLLKYLFRLFLYFFCH